LNVLEGNTRTEALPLVQTDLPVSKPAENVAHLGDALAYMECKVTSRLELSDHWVVYATVEMGRVSKPEALTAVHHRKVANYY